MATVVINNTGSNTNMRLRVTYSNGNGSITITKLEGCRVDGYDTLAYNAGNTNDNRVYISVGGSQILNVHEDNINFTKNSNYSTIWSGSVTKSGLSGGTSVVVTFTASQNSNIGNAYFSTSIDAGYSNPTISIKDNGYDGNHRLNMTGSALSFKITLGNMNGRTGTITFDGNSLGTKNSDGDHTFSIPAANCQSYLNYYNGGTLDFSIIIKVDLGSNLAASALLYIHVSNDIIPTMSSISISGSTAVNSALSSVLNGKYIQNLTKPIISMSGSGVYNSQISSYTLESITGIDIGTKTGLSSPYQVDKPFGASTSVTATAKCIDSRSRPSSSKTSAAVTVIPYSLPSISWTIKRCDSNGTLNNDGEHCLLHVNYTFSPITSNGTNINQSYKEIKWSLDEQTWYDVTPNGTTLGTNAWSGSYDKVIDNDDGSNKFDTSLNYIIYLKFKDISGEIEESKVLDVAFTLISRRAGGLGVTLGKIATEDNFHSYLESSFHNGVKVKDPQNTMRTLVDLIYPLGSIYMSVNNVSPQTFFGGTWTRITGRFLLAATDGGSSGASQAAGNTGGAADHTHGYAHTHNVPGAWHTHGAGTYTAHIVFNSSYFWNKFIYQGSWQSNARKSVGGTSVDNYTNTTEGTEIGGDSGGTTPGTTTTNSQSNSTTGSASNGLPPFVSVYMWKRTG